ncbi:MAG TPA: hypothetical protein PKL83_04025 [bacterium]|nr:hypothetical protein [bacterium]
MDITPEVLETAAQQGAKGASDALAMMTSKQVIVSTSRVEELSLSGLVEVINTPDENNIVAYSQVLTGVPGAALLLLERQEGLKLIDLLTGSPPGTTHELDDMGQSAIKETLNIISNSHINALSADFEMDMGIDVPNLITALNVAEAIDYVAEESGENTTLYVFETILTVEEQYQVNVGLYIIFNPSLAQFIKKMKE